MKISIIIPCYNTAAYLEKCLNSVIQQTYKDWEIILINDGSTDNTADIIRIYTEENTKIKAFIQENQGLSVSRNNGVKRATGEYILFLDSDDWYKNEDCFEQIVRASNNGKADIIAFRLQHIFSNTYYKNDNSQYFEKMIGNSYTGEEYLQVVLSESAIYPWYACRYAFKREFWIKNQIEFRLRAFEDMDLIYSVLLKAQYISILNEFIYQYRVGREGSITQIQKNSVQNRLEVSKNTVKMVNTMDIDESLKKLLNNNFSYEYFKIMIDVNRLKGRDRKDIFALLNENRDLMNYTIYNVIDYCS